MSTCTHLTRFFPAPEILLILLLANVLRCSADRAKFDEDFVQSEYFVDKTELLKDLFTRPSTSDFISCPRGFGKSTNLKMIDKFSRLEFDYKGDTKYRKHTDAYRLFRQLKIAKHDAIMNHHLAKHPVIFLDVGYDLRGEITLANVIASLGAQLQRHFEYYARKVRKWYYRDIQTKIVGDFAKWTEDALMGRLNQTDIERNLHLLTVTLYNCFGSRVIILIDRFDYFVNHAFDAVQHIGNIYFALNAMLKKIFVDFNHRVYILMTSVTSIAFSYNHFDEHMKANYFVDDHQYTPYFGVLDHELDDLFGRYGSTGDEIDFVKSFYRGYRIGDHVKYNAHSVSEYFRAKNTSSPIPTDTYRRPGRKSKYLTNFFKNPNYLDNVSVLITHCSIRGKFQKHYESKAFRPFMKYVKNNFQQINVSKADLMHTFSIEYGFFAPTTQQDSYIIPNYEMRNHLVENLRRYYKIHAKINLKLISSQLLHVLRSGQPPTSEFRFNFSRTLTDEFHKLTSLYQQRISEKFALQSIVHIAARYSKRLKLVQDFPTPISYDDTKDNLEKRCVTLVLHDDAALIVKVTYRQSIQAALHKALSYEYSHANVKVVKCIGIDVNLRNKISFAFQEQNRTS